MTAFLRKILNRNQPNSAPVFNPIASDTRASDGSVLPIPDRVSLSVATAQSIGMQRQHNEDALFSMISSLAYKDISAHIGCFIVADGMGGHLYGEIASTTAVRVMGEFIIRNLLLESINGNPNLADISWEQLFNDGIQQANLAVQKAAPGGGTTLTTMVIANNHILLAHVGDSRAYKISPTGEIMALTRDHTLVHQLVEMGNISPEEAESHPQRNMLYLAIGQFEDLQADISDHSLPENGHLLLCSDGLWGVISDETIATIVKSAASLEAACQELIDAANQAGGPDNITAVLVQIHPEQSYAR